MISLHGPLEKSTTPLSEVRHRSISYLHPPMTYRIIRRWRRRCMYVSFIERNLQRLSPISSSETSSEMHTPDQHTSRSCTNMPSLVQTAEKICSIPQTRFIAETQHHRNCAVCRDLSPSAFPAFSNTHSSAEFGNGDQAFWDTRLSPMQSVPSDTVRGGPSDMEER